MIVGISACQWNQTVARRRGVRNRERYGYRREPGTIYSVACPKPRCANRAGAVWGARSLIMAPSEDGTRLVVVGARR